MICDLYFRQTCSCCTKMAKWVNSSQFWKLLLTMVYYLLKPTHLSTQTSPVTSKPSWTKITNFRQPFTKVRHKPTNHPTPWTPVKLMCPLVVCMTAFPPETVASCFLKLVQTKKCHVRTFLNTFCAMEWLHVQSKWDSFAQRSGTVTSNQQKLDKWMCFRYHLSI